MCQKQPYECKQKHVIYTETTNCIVPNACHTINQFEVLDPIILPNSECSECKELPYATISFYKTVGEEESFIYHWPSKSCSDEFIVLFIQLAIQGWRSRRKEWEEGGKQTPKPRPWSQNERQDAALSVLLAMKPEHQPTGGPQSSNPRKATELENKSFYYPRGYNGEGSSKSGGIDTPKTKRPNPSGPEDDRHKGKGKGKATHLDPESQARKSPSPDYSYPASKSSAPAKSVPSVSTTGAVVHTAGSKPTSSSSTSGPTRRNTGESASSSKPREYNPFHDPTDKEFNTYKWAIGSNYNRNLSAEPSPTSSREQSPAPHASRSSSHVANQSSASHGKGKEQRSRASSRASSKESVDRNAFVNDFVDLSPARAPTSTHTPPHSTGASHSVPGSHTQHVRTPVNTTTGQTAARQNTGTASKSTTQSSSSSSGPKQDKSDKGKKPDKGKGPARRK